MNAPFSGTLRNRVRFDRPQYSRDRSGERVATWLAPGLAEDDPVIAEAGSFFAWARVRSQKGSEGIAAGQLLPTATHTIELRFREDITAEMSCVYDGQRLDILSEPIDPDGTRERLMIYCEYRGGAA